MTIHRMRLSVGSRQLDRLPTTDFVWRPPPSNSSFRTDIAPGLEQFSGARRANIEFVRVAVLAYLVDRTTPRPYQGWLRHLEIHVPVWEPDPWTAAADELAEVLGFLTSDQWRLTFYKARTPRAPELDPAPTGPAASLFSGGADSLAGAIITRADLGDAPILVSHRDASAVSGAQDRLAAKLAVLWGADLSRAAATVGRKSAQIGSGEPFGEELSSRSRSFLFVALGLAVASASGVPLRIPENGFASINAPMGGERRGALSTRTTHPWYLWRLGHALERVGAHTDIENPFSTSTKSQMYERVVAIIGADQASALLSEADSCARGGDLRFAGVKGARHCGVCFGCLVRRAAFLASGVDDLTIYAVDDLAMPLGSLAHGWYNEKRARDLQAVRYAAARGVDAAEVTRTLPPHVDSTSAVDIVKRGLAELGALVL